MRRKNKETERYRDEVIKAARKVLRTWTGGDLAGAVRGLADVLLKIKRKGGKL